jgi:hypothetical protein
LELAWSDVGVLVDELGVVAGELADPGAVLCFKRLGLMAGVS